MVARCTRENRRRGRRTRDVDAGVAGWCTTSKSDIAAGRMPRLSDQENVEFFFRNDARNRGRLIIDGLRVE